MYLGLRSRDTFRGLLRRVGKPRVPTDKTRPQTQITIWLTKGLGLLGEAAAFGTLPTEEYESVFLAMQGLQPGEAFGRHRLRQTELFERHAGFPTRVVLPFRENTQGTSARGALC